MNSRKKSPVYRGVLAFFPLALRAVAHVTHVSQRQHIPDGEEIQWDRTKSTDHADCLMRHLLDHARGEELDNDGLPHIHKVAWRALALSQEYEEAKNARDARERDAHDKRLGFDVRELDRHYRRFTTAVSAEETEETEERHD